MLYKLLAICVIAISEFVFMKWAQYNQRVKQQRQQYQQQQREDEFAARVRPDTPGESTETSAQAQYPLGFDFDGLEGQDVCKQPLTKLKDLRQQLRMQQQHFNQQFEQQKQEHGQELQRVCLGMDTRDERQNLELQRLQQQLQRQQTTIDQHNRLFDKTNQTIKEPDRQHVDPQWDTSIHSEDDWQKALLQMNKVVGRKEAGETQHFAIGATMGIDTNYMEVR